MHTTESGATVTQVGDELLMAEGKAWLQAPGVDLTDWQ